MPDYCVYVRSYKIACRSLVGPDPFQYCASAPRKGLGVILYLSREGFLMQLLVDTSLSHELLSVGS